MASSLLGEALSRSPEKVPISRIGKKSASGPDLELIPTFT